ncbi:helix-turn-helix domain-containing protein [Vibrio comitans]
MHDNAKYNKAEDNKAIQETTVVRPVFIKPIFEHALALGLPVKEILRDEGGDEYHSLVYQPHTLTLPAQPVRVVMALAEKQGLDTFGLDAALNAGANTILPEMRPLVESSGNLYEFLSNFCQYTNQYLSLFNFFDLESEPNGVFLRRNHNFMTPLASDSMEVYTLTLLSKLIENYLQTPWQPKIIWVSAQQVNSAFSTHFRSAYIFTHKPVSKIFIEDKTLKRRSPLYLAKSVPSATPMATPSMRALVVMALQPFALDALPTIERLSKLLGLHPKKVQLKLAEESCTYRQMLIELKAKHAEQLIRNTDFDIGTVALESGYTNSTHFIRAMKKIWGVTPLQFAKSIRNKS